MLVSQYLGMANDISDFVYCALGDCPTLSDDSEIVDVFFLFSQALSSREHEYVYFIFEIGHLFGSKDLEKRYSLLEDR
jgi:hypothetical protein